MTAAPHELVPMVARVIDMFGNRPKRRRELNELTKYGAGFGELQPIARDLNVTPADLERLVRPRPQSANELTHMLAALDIDEGALRGAEPTLLRDMERVCLLCTHRPQCHRKLAAGTAAANYVEFCENADLIDILRFKS